MIRYFALKSQPQIEEDLDQGRQPDRAALSFIELICDILLTSGNLHVYRGRLNSVGMSVLDLWERAVLDSAPATTDPHAYLAFKRQHMDRILSDAG